MDEYCCMDRVHIDHSSQCSSAGNYFVGRLSYLKILKLGYNGNFLQSTRTSFLTDSIAASSCQFSKTFTINLPIVSISGSLNPLVVNAGVPILIPLGLKGVPTFLPVESEGISSLSFGPNGIMFLFVNICALSSATSACFPET